MVIAVCSICGTPSSGYDSLPERLFEFVPMWGLRIFFRYAMRRVNCPRCQRVVVEKVPWCDGKNHFTNHYAAFLASWAKELSWKSVAAHFHTSWQTVCSAVESVVNYGLTHRNLDSVTALGVDEIAWHKGHKYLTLVYQINPGARRLLWVGEKRTQETMNSFFADMTKLKADFSAQIRVICSDMWKPYLKMIAKHLPQAINVLDRFHIMQKFGRALDKVRADEAKRLRQAKQPPLLSKSRWCFLKRRENLTEKQGFKLNELLKMNLRTVKAYLLREQFQKLWEYRSPGWAGKFLEQWRHAAIFSRLEPMKDLAKDADRSSSFDLELFQGKKAVQQWDRRRVEQENKSDYQKIIRISDAQNCKSVLISPAWRTPGTGFRPQILVKRLTKKFLRPEKETAATRRTLLRVSPNRKSRRRNRNSSDRNFERPQ